MSIEGSNTLRLFGIERSETFINNFVAVTDVFECTRQIRTSLKTARQFDMVDIKQGYLVSSIQQIGAAKFQ